MLKTKKTPGSVCLGLVTAVLLSACGQKGPLYLPPKAALSANPCQTPTNYTITDRQHTCRAA